MDSNLKRVLLVGALVVIALLCAGLFVAISANVAALSSFLPFRSLFHSVRPY